MKNGGVATIYIKYDYLEIITQCCLYVQLLVINRNLLEYVLVLRGPIFMPIQVGTYTLMGGYV